MATGLYSRIILVALALVIFLQPSVRSTSVSDPVALMPTAWASPTPKITVASEATVEQRPKTTREPEGAPTRVVEPTSSARLPQSRNEGETSLVFNAGFWSELVANLVGALVGAMLAIPTGLWLDRRVKSREQQERTIIVLRAIRDELVKNQAAMEDFLAKQPVEGEITYPSLTNDAWQAAQGLDFLSALADYELHKTLIGVYERIDFVTRIAQSLWNMFFSPMVNFGVLDRKVKILIEALREETQQTIPMIEEAIVEVQNRFANQDS